jgi:type I restriction enzyme S subunit
MKAELPNNWAEVPLRDILLRTQNTNPATDREGTIRYIDIDAVDNNIQEVSNPKVLECGSVPSRARKEIECGDVIFSLVRPYLKNLAIIPPELHHEIASTAFYVCRLAGGVKSEWLYQHLRRDSVIQNLPTIGSSPPATRDVDFENHLVPLASEAEQTRTLAILEPALAKIDEAQESLERVRKNLERYRASVLKAACEGRLVPNEADLARREGRDYEPASKLLSRILVARRKAWETSQLEAYQKKGKIPPKDWKSRYLEPKAPDTSDLPGLPEGWCWATIDQLCSRITSGSRDWSPYYGTGPGVFVMAQNVRMGRFDLWSTQLVNPPKDNRDRDRSLIQKDDLLVTIVGAKTGDVCRVDVELEEHFVCQSVALLRPVRACAAKYMEAFLCSESGGQAHFRKFTYGQGRPHLGFDQLQAVIVPLPPAREQEVIIEKIEEIVSSLSKVQGTAVNELERCHTLRQSLLKHAFSGKLVPQDPRDEPAAVLLERIRAQRKEQAAAVKALTSRAMKTPAARANRPAAARRKRSPGTDVGRANG